MIYAVSDLHGCYDKYRNMLEKIHFSETDTLYILGDVVDRGDGSIRILQDMAARRNVIPIKGNHDFLAHRFLTMISQNQKLGQSKKQTETYLMWLSDGGEPTYRAFLELSPDEQKHILAYMNTFLLYEEVEAGGNRFFLSHTVPEKERMQHFDTLMWQELIIGEPEYEKQYFPDQYIVTGHTPTKLIDKTCVGRIYQKNHHIAIDCGAVFGHALGCICLDTLEEYYTE